MKAIPINPKSFQDVLGIPAGPLPVETDEESGKIAFLALYGLSEVPTIRYFGDRIIKNNNLSDDDFCRCFMSVLLGVFICPNSSARPSTKYMGALIDVDKIKERNWCKFAHDWLMLYIKKYQKQRAKHTNLSLTLGGCIYQLTVRYLDFLDFGGIQLPSTIPRINVWKGKLIKHFSELDKGTDGIYGITPIKDWSQTCYAEATRSRVDNASDLLCFKKEIEKVTADNITYDMINEIYNCFQSHMVDADTPTFFRAKTLVLDCLKIILGETNKTVPSQTTVVLETEGSNQEEDENEDLIHRKRRHISNEHNDQQCHNHTESYMNNVTTESEARNDLANKQPESNVMESSILSLNHTPGRSLSLNHTPSDDDGINSSSLKPMEQENEKQLHHNEESTKCASALVVTHTAVTENDKKGSKPDTPVSREENLTEASKKYFFVDPSVPSFRLVDWHDDNGKFIDELELRRPLHYNLINQHKNEAQNEGQQNKANCSYVCSPPKNESTAYKHNTDTDFEFSSIQCAQRQKSYSHRNEHCNKHLAEQHEFIDLDPSQPSQPSQPMAKTEKNARINIAGRKLFQDDFDDSPINIGSKMRQPKNPEVEFMYENLRNEEATPPNSPEVQFMGVKICKPVETSPEVQFMGERSSNPSGPASQAQLLGERSINKTFNDMSDLSDNLYNAGLSLGSTSFSRGKENKPPKRVVNRSSFLCSPFEINSTISTKYGPHEMKLYETITTLCDDPEYHDRWIINMNNCRVSLKQLGCSMKQEGWVEAWVINCYCRKLFKDNHPKKSQKHFFFHTTTEYFLEKWPNEYMRKIWQKNVIKGFQGADSARKLHLSERIHFPSLYNRHWFLFAVDMRVRKFLFMDSLCGEASELHREVDDMMITNFKKTWAECNLKDMHFETFGKAYPNLPKQRTPNDCGVFLIKYMERYCTRNPNSCSFPASDIPDYRVQIAIDTLFNDYNSEVEEMDFISTFDLESYKKRTLGKK